MKQLVTLEFIFQIKGKGTEILSAKKEGEEIGHRLVVEGGKTLEFTEENMKKLDILPLKKKCYRELSGGQQGKSAHAGR